MHYLKHSALIFLVIFSLLLLAGCGKITVTEPSAAPTAAPTPVPTPEPTVDPRVAWDGTEICGASISIDAEKINIEGISSADIDTLLQMLPYMDHLQTVELGSEENNTLSWDDIYALEQAAPQAEFNYTFSAFNQSFDLSSTEMNFSHVIMDDNGALVRSIARCMKHLTYLDMDSCEVPDEEMAQIRDENPNTNVVWRIWFGDNYSVRTDVETILASNPGQGGDLISFDTNTKSLQYCTKVKNLDVGHNDNQLDISYVAYMPELEVFIGAMGQWSDLSPLANCPNLRYLEIQTTAVSDISVLSNCKNLKSLSICDCFSLQDISPLYDLDSLEYLWIGQLTPVPASQVAEMQSRHPNLTINTTTIDPTDEGWRYTGYNAETGMNDTNPEYAYVREVFNYNAAPACYSYYWNDPLY